MESSGRFERIFFKMLRENNTAGGGEGSLGSGSGFNPSKGEIGSSDWYAPGSAINPTPTGKVRTRKGSTGKKNKKKKTDGLDGVYLTGGEDEEGTHPGYEDTTWSDGKLTITMQEVEEELAKQGFPDEKGGEPVNPKDIKHLDIHTRHKPNKTPEQQQATLDRAMKANWDYSIIVSKKDGEYVEVLDGNHRLHKAVEKGKDTINVRPLDLSKVPDEWVSVFG